MVAEVFNFPAVIANSVCLEQSPPDTGREYECKLNGQYCTNKTAFFRTFGFAKNLYIKPDIGLTTGPHSRVVFTIVGMQNGIVITENITLTEADDQARKFFYTEQIYDIVQSINLTVYNGSFHGPMGILTVGDGNIGYITPINMIERANPDNATLALAFTSSGPVGEVAKYSVYRAVGELVDAVYDKLVEDKFLFPLTTPKQQGKQIIQLVGVYSYLLIKVETTNNDVALITTLEI